MELSLPPPRPGGSASSRGALRGCAHAGLREDTKALHDRLDARLDVSSLASRLGYVRYLLMNWCCATVEPALSEAGIHRLLPDWELRQRRFALADDLLALGVSPGPPRPCAIEPDAGTLLGWSYVLEGSRLGARLILQIVERSEETQVRSATRFLRHGEGADLWGTFKTALSRIDHDTGAIDRACRAAKLAFQYFGAPTSP